MDFFSAAGGHVWSLLSYLVPFLFVLGLVVFVHEMGHYLVGRWCGVGVDAFALGFGPKLFGWHDKRGTEWKLCAIPLGGYVKFKGDLNGASVPDNELIDSFSEADRKDAFQFKPVWQRAAIVAAGPIANFVLALVIFSATFMFIGRYVIDPVVDQVSPGSPAAVAGIQSGDRIISIDGEAIDSFEAIRRGISTANNGPVVIEVARQGRVHAVKAEPQVVEQKTSLGIVRSRVLGISSSSLPEHHRLMKYGFVDSLELSGGQIVGLIKQSVNYLGGLVRGREKADQLSGPIRIAQVSGKVAESGIVSLLSLAALLSISIGFINLMPIPLLDGGHLMFYAFEAAFGRPLNRRAQEMLFRFGLTLVLALMAFSVVNDIVQITKG
mgnify:CR=1 FL=1